jgi:hypothetical protein
MDWLLNFQILKTYLDYWNFMQLNLPILKL